MGLDVASRRIWLSSFVLVVQLSTCLRAQSLNDSRELPPIPLTKQQNYYLDYRTGRLPSPGTESEIREPLLYRLPIDTESSTTGLNLPLTQVLSVANSTPRANAGGLAGFGHGQALGI